MTANDEMLAQRAAEIEAQAKGAVGEEHWKAAMRSLEEQVKTGSLTQHDLLQKMSRPDAASQLFNDGISNASEADWRAWRDAQPNRKRRIEKAAR